MTNWTGIGATYFACSMLGEVFGQVVAENDDEARLRLDAMLDADSLRQWRRHGMRVAVAIGLVDNYLGEPDDGGAKHENNSRPSPQTRRLPRGD